jgi:hypothetical protein
VAPAPLCCRPRPGRALPRHTRSDRSSAANSTGLACSQPRRFRRPRSRRSSGTDLRNQAGTGSPLRPQRRAGAFRASHIIGISGCVAHSARPRGREFAGRHAVPPVRRSRRRNQRHWHVTPNTAGGRVLPPVVFRASANGCIPFSAVPGSAGEVSGKLLLRRIILRIIFSTPVRFACVTWRNWSAVANCPRLRRAVDELFLAEFCTEPLGRRVVPIGNRRTKRRTVREGPISSHHRSRQSRIAVSSTAP